MSKHSAAQPNNPADAADRPADAAESPRVYPCNHELKKIAKNNFAYCKCEFLAWYGRGSGDTAWKEAPEWKREWFPDLDRPRSSSCGPLGTDGGNMTFGGFCEPAGVTPIGGRPTPTAKTQNEEKDEENDYHKGFPPLWPGKATGRGWWTCPHGHTITTSFGRGVTGKCPLCHKQR
jgi:hypothetical protein